MSQVDASIPLQIKKPEFMSPAQAISLQGMVQQIQAQKIQQTQALDTMQKAARVQQRLSMPDATGPDGLFTNVALADITRMAPEIGTHITGQVQNIRTQQDQAKSRLLSDQSNQLQIAERVDKSQREVVSAAVSYVDSKMPNAPEDKKDQAVREQVQKGLDRQEQSGMYPYPDEQWKKLRSHPYTYGEAKAWVTTPKEVTAQQNREEKASVAADQATQKSDMAAERLRIEQEKLKMQKEREAKKAEGESGRAAVFTNRMITSANEAMRGLENVVKLPVTSSRGWFGGRQQEGGILAAGKETLANKLTTEEVQLYNVMTAGIQRNLASIEAVGLMPSGALTHMMDNVIIKEGDTQLTKAAKLAEIRQILDAGMEPILANPKVPDDLKKLVKTIQERVEKAVPYTQEDVIRLMGSTEKGATLGSIVKGQRKDETSGATVRPYKGNSGNTPGDIQDLLDKYK